MTKGSFAWLLLAATALCTAQQLDPNYALTCQFDDTKCETQNDYAFDVELSGAVIATDPVYGNYVATSSGYSVIKFPPSLVQTEEGLNFPLTIGERGKEWTYAVLVLMSPEKRGYTKALFGQNNGDSLFYPFLATVRYDDAGALQQHQTFSVFKNNTLAQEAYDTFPAPVGWTSILVTSNGTHAQLYVDGLFSGEAAHSEMFDAPVVLNRLAEGDLGDGIDSFYHYPYWFNDTAAREFGLNHSKARVGRSAPQATTTVARTTQEPWHRCASVRLLFEIRMCLDAF